MTSLLPTYPTAEQALQGSRDEALAPIATASVPRFPDGIANEIWNYLAGKGLVDDLGGAEYQRRIIGLQEWVADPDGQPPRGA